jgi:hypothetical protein
VTNNLPSYIDTTNYNIVHDNHKGNKQIDYNYGHLGNGCGFYLPSRCVKCFLLSPFNYHKDHTMLDSQKIFIPIPFCLGRIGQPFWKISNNLMWHSIGKRHLIIHCCKTNIFMCACVHMLYYITYNGHNNLVICL